MNNEIEFINSGDNATKQNNLIGNNVEKICKKAFSECKL